MGIQAGDLYTQREIVQNYLIPQGKKNGVVWIGVGLGIDNLAFALDETSWRGNIANSVGRMYDSTNGYWKDSLPKNWRTFISHVPEATINLVPEVNGGICAFPAQGWGDAVINGLASDFDSNNVRVREALDIWYAMADSATAAGIHMLFVTMPVHPGYADAKVYGPSGMSIPLAKWILGKIQAKVATSPLLHYYDANMFSQHDYTNAEAYDLQHLSIEGAQKLSSRIRDSLMLWGVPTK